MGCKKCRTIQPNEEVKIMAKAFIVFMIVQTIFVSSLSIISINNLQIAHFSWFFPFDLITLLIAIIILSIIILVSGISSATSNISFAWLFFHVFMFLLLLIELIVSWFSSDVNQFLDLAQEKWYSGDDEIQEIQNDLKCCGFLNCSDHPNDPCPINTTLGCQERLQNLMIGIRNTASIALFIDFVFALFLDFVGWAICYHPDFVTLEEYESEVSSYTNLNTPQIS